MIKGVARVKSGTMFFFAGGDGLVWRAASADNQSVFQVCNFAQRICRKQIYEMKGE